MFDKIATIVTIVLCASIALLQMIRYVNLRLETFMRLVTDRHDVRVEQLTLAVEVQNRRIEDLENTMKSSLNEIKRYQQDPPGISC